MLEQEGVEFDAKGKCDLSKYEWWPEGFGPIETQPSLLR
jgi:hypothetical protein